jgi:sorting nexin-29
MLKADMETLVKWLKKIYDNIWREKVTPREWSRGILTTIPKKGDLTECSNWRGIPLLLTPSKVLGNIIIKRIKEVLDEKLRKEQAGFRSGRRTSDQIYILRNIIEQSVEWQAPLYLNFLDFEKAFDSIHRDTL